MTKLLSLGLGQCQLNSLTFPGGKSRLRATTNCKLWTERCAWSSCGMLGTPLASLYPPSCKMSMQSLPSRGPSRKHLSRLGPTLLAQFHSPVKDFLALRDSLGIWEAQKASPGAGPRRSQLSLSAWPWEGEGLLTPASHAGAAEN